MNGYHFLAGGQGQGPKTYQSMIQTLKTGRQSLSDGVDYRKSGVARRWLKDMSG